MAPRYATLLAALALTLLGTALPSPAPAQPAEPGDDVQAQIDAQLKAFPGGVQTGPYEVSYDNGGFVITFARSDLATAGVADCPRGWFCFYDAVNFGYPRGKLSDCGWQDLARWGWSNRTESAQYNISSGSVAFIDHDEEYPYHEHDVALFGMGTTQPMIYDAYPYRNIADHVMRYC